MRGQNANTIIRKYKCEENKKSIPLWRRGTFDDIHKRYLESKAKASLIILSHWYGRGSSIVAPTQIRTKQSHNNRHSHEWAKNEATIIQQPSDHSFHRRSLWGIDFAPHMSLPANSTVKAAIARVELREVIFRTQNLPSTRFQLTKRTRSGSHFDQRWRCTKKSHCSSRGG